MQITRFLSLVVLCVASCAAAQVSGGCMLVPRKLPDELQSSLQERLSTFLTAQAAEHWDDVAELLGRCRFGCTRGNLYTDSYKQCLVSRMQEARMLDFDSSIQDPSICVTTEKEMEPIGEIVDRFAAERSSWYLRGTGRFQTSLEDWLEQTNVIAYRDQGQWYFTPPQWQMQDKWEKAHYTEADFARDRRDEIEVRNSPSSPVEIIDVHAYINRRYPSLRNLTFKLRNKTPKKVTALTVWIHNETITGEEDLSEGPIQPMGQLAEEDASFPVYIDFCEGVWKHTMLIKDVGFADGSKWLSKQPGKSER
jgi:hypothetical protein